jgi:WhiB family redox-sensing transcriptional regulator
MNHVTQPDPYWTGILPDLPQAACKNLDPDDWFSPDLGIMRTAARVCQHCPERSPCLAFALDHDIDIGVWGGLLPHERGRPPRHRAAS